MEQLFSKQVQRYELEFRMRHKDGHWVWIYSVGNIHSWTDKGEPHLISGIHLDITVQKTKEEELAQAHYLIEYFVEHNNGGVAILDKSLRYLYVSQRWIKQFDLSENIIGKSHYELFPEVPEKFREAHRRSLLGEVVCKKRDTFLRRSGVTEYTNWETRPWRQRDGSIGGIIIYVEMITAQVKKEAELEYASFHDFLTGMYNRRSFSEYLLDKDHESHLPLSLIILDVNGLKIFNDAFGNSEGDQVLRLVAVTLLDICGEKDTPFRIGGDEFAVATVNTTEAEAEAKKEAIHQAIEAKSLHNVPLSVSVGYGIREHVSKTLEELLREAETYMYKRKILESRSSRSGSIRGILQTLNDKFLEEKTHSERVSFLCRKMGEAMGMNEDNQQELEMAGMIHDIGKISIPDNILYKPASLDPEEYELMKAHTQRGYQILRAADEFSDLAVYALSHHEWYNGKGYPNQLAGLDIPLFARIICIADAYEAMTADRPYRKALPRQVAIRELEAKKGEQFDPELTRIFVDKVIPQEDPA